MTIKEAVESIGTILVIDDEPDIRKRRRTGYSQARSLVTLTYRN